MSKEEQGVFTKMTAVCRRASEQQKGQSGVKDPGLGGKLAWVWEKRRMSSASVISEGTEESGALQVKKTELLPLGKKTLPDLTVEKTTTSREWETAKFVHEGRDKYRNLCSLQQSHAMIFSRIFPCIWMEAKYKLKPLDLPKHMHMPTQSPRQEWYKPSLLLLALLGRGGVETEIAAKLQE